MPVLVIKKEDIKLEPVENPSAYLSGELQKVVGIRKGIIRKQTNPALKSSLSARMLWSPLRQFVIDEVKSPLRIAIEQSKGKLSRGVKRMAAHYIGQMMSKFGKLKRKDLWFRNSQSIQDIKAEFMSYEDNWGRDDMISNAFDIWTYENEHDGWYRYRGDVVLELWLNKVLAGEWEPRPAGFPETHWHEPTPYGGEHSIVAKVIAHRAEINKLIGE